VQYTDAAEAGVWRAITAVPGLPGFLFGEAERGGAGAVAVVLARFGIASGPGP
jgi:hypothetical protein